jgi:hypothetical protein
MTLVWERTQALIHRLRVAVIREAGSASRSNPKTALSEL